MGYWDKEVAFETLKGKSLKEIKDTGDQIIFVTEDDERYVQYHEGDCCEVVSVEEVVGDYDDLIGSPILLAEEVTYVGEDPPEVIIGEDKRYRESWTWTFYKLATIKGSVTIRWYGTSNGYYSESVSFRKD